MTQDEINALPPDRLTALLAERVMGWSKCDGENCDGCNHRVLKIHFQDVWVVYSEDFGRIWDPTTDRNDLAELMRRLPNGEITSVDDAIMSAYCDAEYDDSFSQWLLTCDAAIICRAVAVACLGGDDNA